MSLFVVMPFVVKLPLCLINPHDIKVQEKEETEIHALLTAALD
jgi:hypothetical protein